MRTSLIVLVERHDFALRLVASVPPSMRAAGDSVITGDHLARACELEQIDTLGLGIVERKYLNFLAEGASRPMCCQHVGAAIEDCRRGRRPFLLRNGLVIKDDGGRRQLTAQGREHLANCGQGLCLISIPGVSHDQQHRDKGFCDPSPRWPESWDYPGTFQSVDGDGVPVPCVQHHDPPPALTPRNFSRFVSKCAAATSASQRAAYLFYAKGHRVVKATRPTTPPKEEYPESWRLFEPLGCP